MKTQLPYSSLEAYHLDLLTYVDLSLAAYHTATQGAYDAHTLGWLTKAQTPEAQKSSADALAKGLDIQSRVDVTDLLLPLELACQTFNLSALERFMLMLSMATELEPSFAHTFVQFNEDAAFRHPTVGLALKIFAEDTISFMQLRSTLTSQTKLFKYFMTSTLEKYSDLPIISLPLSLDRSVVDFFMNFDTYTLKHPFLKLYYPNSVNVSLTDALTLSKLEAFVVAHHEMQPEDTLFFMLHGPKGVGKHDTVYSFCNAFDQTALIVNCRALSLSSKSLSEINIMLREAMLHRALLVFDDFDVFIEKLRDSDMALPLEALIDAVRQYAKIGFALSETPWHPERAFQDFSIIDVPMVMPSASDRYALWRTALSHERIDQDVDLHAIANTFKFSPEQIQRSVRAAENLKLWENTETLSSSTLQKACYLQVSSDLKQLALRLVSKYTLEDLILPEEHYRQILEACHQIRFKHVVYQDWGFEHKVTYGTGLGMLFTGPPGTGKTLSAQVIANYLGLELYRVDLSQVISKYIGETEKNLKLIFDEAEKSHAILLFDEGDALFSKRTDVGDAKDKYANVETSFLLQKIEAYPGIAIVTTNLISNIDEAFIRRFAFVIHFPFPNVEQRHRIWKQIFPEETPVSHQLDYEFLSENFELSGGNIKNIALNAAFLAASQNRSIQMVDLVRSIASEITKTGKAIIPSDFEPYSYLL